MEIKMRYLAAILLTLVLPVTALAGSQQIRTVVGMAKAAGSSEFCDGTDTFCTSWETGTNALNTGATGNEDVLDNMVGTMNLITTSPAEGSKCIQGNSGAYVETSNGGSGFGNSVTVTGYFRLDDENAGAGYIVALYDASNYYTFFYLRRAADGNTINDIIPIEVFAKTTSGTLVQLGSLTDLAEDVWYSYSLVYSTTADNTRLIIYDSSLATVYDSGDNSVTLNFDIDRVQFYAQSGGNRSHDAVKVNP